MLGSFAHCHEHDGIEFAVLSLKEGSRGGARAKANWAEHCSQCRFYSLM
jgi:hypothetical protein